MSSKKFTYTKRKFNKRNFSDVIEVMIPDQYLESDIDISGTVLSPELAIINSHLDIANNIVTILPLSGGSQFSGLSSLGDIKAFFIKQNNFTDISAESFERNILNIVDKSFRDFTTSSAFKEYVDETLIPIIQTNEPKYDFSGLSGIDNLTYNLGWFYFLAGSSTYSYQPSAVVSDYLVNYTYRGKSLTIAEGINALTEFVWRNQASLADYIPTDFLSGTSTYTSGTQNLEKLKTLNSVIYSTNLLDRDDEKVSDAFELFEQTEEYFDERTSNGPFWRLIKAFSYAFADQQEEVNQLSVLYDLEDCPDHLLPELAKLIGWDLIGYDPDRWRLQLANAVDVYKKAGTKQSILAAVNSVFTPGVLDLSSNITELWESYIPFLILYALATESIHFENYSTWTREKAESLNVDSYDLSNFDNNIKLAVDRILLTLYEEYSDHFILAGTQFQVGNENFVFNYRGRDYPIPPFEEIPYYLQCRITSDFLFRLADLLVCFGVKESFALTVKDYIEANTIRAADGPYEDYSDNNGWLFFTLAYQQPPNWSTIVFDPTNKKEKYLSLWSGKSSHYKLNFRAVNFDFSKDTFEVDSRLAILYASRLADLFAPAHAIRNTSLFASENDYYQIYDRRDVSLVLDKINSTEVLSSTILGNFELSALDLLGSLSEFSGGRYSFSSLVTTPLSSTNAILADRNTYRRRGLTNRLDVVGYYDRTGFNPPIFTDMVSNQQGYTPIVREYNLSLPDKALYNPMKGYYPFFEQGTLNKSLIPHSTELAIMGMSSLYVDAGATSSITFSALEERLNAISSLNCQAVVRIYIDYPIILNPETGLPVNPAVDRTYALPLFLRTENGGPVSAQQYYVPAQAQLENNTTSGFVPDYSSSDLTNECIRLIEQLGATYDGDPRVAMFQVGFAGHWGEWNNYQAWAGSLYPVTYEAYPITFVNALSQAFADNFSQTYLTGRYLDTGQGNTLPNTPTLLTSLEFPIGIHDDSYAWNTLGDKAYHTYRQISFYNLQNKYLTYPQAGEIRPAIQYDLDVYNNNYQNAYNTKPQNLFTCIKTLGTTLLSNGICFSEFLRKLSDGTLTTDQVTNLLLSIHILGYNFHIQSSYFPTTWYKNIDIPIIVSIENLGSAPFYANWPVIITLTDGVSTLDYQTSFDLSSAQPDNPEFVIETIPASLVQATFPVGGDLNVYLSVEKPADFINDITFLNSEHITNTEYMNLGIVRILDETYSQSEVTGSYKIPLGLIPSSLSFAEVSANCSGIISSIPEIYNRCITNTSANIYGYPVSSTLRTRGYKGMPEAPRSVLINNPTAFMDRGQLDPYIAVVHKVADQSVRKRYEKFVEDNSSTYLLETPWKDVVDSLANEEIYCSGLFLSSLQAYENFGLGKKIPVLYDLYTSAFNRHPVRYDPYRDFGPSIYAHAFGSILENSDFETRGTVANTYNLYTTETADTKVLSRNSIYFSGDESNLQTYQTNLVSSVSSIIASSTVYAPTYELVNSSIIHGVDIIHTSGASEHNHFVIYDLQKVDGRSFIYNNSFLRLKSVNGLPRIRFKIPGSDHSDAYDQYRQDNFLCPEHDFRLKLKGLASTEDGRSLVNARLGIWIHTDTENTDQTWHFGNDGRWHLIKTDEITIPKILRDLTHVITFDQKSRDDLVFQCLDSSSLFATNFLSGIGTFGEDEYQDYEIKFNTRNYCRIKVPEEYYKHNQKVHRLDQSYVVEVFMIPEAANRDRFILIEDIDLRDETIYDMTRIDVTGTPTGHKKYPLCEIKHVDLSKEDIRSVLNYYNKLSGKSYHIGTMGRDASESSGVNFVSGGSRLDFRINPEFLYNTKDPDTNHFSFLDISMAIPEEVALITLGSQFSPPGDVSGIGTVPIDPEDLALLNYGFWFG